jgi:hypothetical protein
MEAGANAGRLEWEMIELWQPIADAPGYSVSTTGRVQKDGWREMSSRQLVDGTRTVTLTVNHEQQIFVLRRLVAAAFCSVPDVNCDSVIHLNGDFNDCEADNLAWRPRWFAWRYTRQFRQTIPARFDVHVINTTTGQTSPSVPAAGMIDGTLWVDVYRSMVEHRPTYPYGYHYEAL